MSNTQTLQCAAGHDWQRPAQRGRKPLYCPHHTPVVKSDGEIERPVVVEVASYVTPEDVQSVISSGDRSDEDVRKLSYIERQLSSGRRDSHDVNSLLYSRRLIMERRNRVSA